MKLINDNISIGPLSSHVGDLTFSWLKNKDLLLTNEGKVYNGAANSSASRSPLNGDNAEGNSPKSESIVPNSAAPVKGGEPKTVGDTIAELDRLIAEDESGAAPSGKAEGLPSRAEALGLGFVSMHDRIFKQRIQPLDRLNRIVSLWHRHRLYSANGVRPS